MRVAERRDAEQQTETNLQVQSQEVAEDKSGDKIVSGYETSGSHMQDAASWWERDSTSSLKYLLQVPRQRVKHLKILHGK